MKLEATVSDSYTDRCQIDLIFDTILKIQEDSENSVTTRRTAMGALCPKDSRLIRQRTSTNDCTKTERVQLTAHATA